MLHRTSALVRKSVELAFDRVVCVIPPSLFLLDERVFMTIGILKVAAMLEKAGIAVDMLDLSGIENYLEAAENHFVASGARAIAFTATTPQMPPVTKLVEVARRAVPNARLILGGPHATLTHAAYKMEKKQGRIGRAHRAQKTLEEMFDVLVSGDGELAVFSALVENPEKVVDADDPRGGLFMSNADYEESPFPARHLVDVESYRYSIEGHRAHNLIAQLGCPFACSFCGGRNSNMLRRIRTRSTASIIRELEELYTRYGFTGYMLHDDELNVNKEMVSLMNEIAALQKRLGTEFRLRGFIKAELFNEEQAEVMFRAGFRWLLCGFEAGDPRILTNINKKSTLEDNTRVIEIAKKYGLKTKALMSVGHAGENEASIRAVRDWLVDVKPEDFDCTVITTYPGTPYYDEALPHESLPDVWTFTAKKSGDRLHAYDLDYTRVADYYKGDPKDGYTSHVFTDHLSAEEIVRLRNWVEEDVRATLGIPFNTSAAARRYEHSMGQSELPPFILRRSGQ